jgi:DNA-directed RNA polymerase specialized sigma24 family protein
MQNGPAQGRSAYEGETDGDLVVYMSLGKDDVPASRAAWEEFYSRHATYLYAVCLRAYGAFLGGEPGVCDLVADTFHRAYEHAGTFDDGGIKNPDRQRLRARAWLGRIAQRLVQSTLRSQSRVPTCFLAQDDWQNLGQAQPRTTEGPAQIEWVREAFLALSEREQLVLRVTLQWYRPGEEHQRLPNDVASDLARTLQTTPENLRQIRHRALRKAESFLRERKAQMKKRDSHEE